MWRTFAILALAAACHALPAQDTSHSENEIEGFSDCLKKDSTTCLKYKFFSFVDKMMGHRDTFSLTDGVTVVRASDVPAETGAPRALNPVDKVKNYFETHSLRVEVKGSDVIDSVTSAGRALEDTVSWFTEDTEQSEEGRGKKKKAAKILGPLIAALMLKKMMLMKLAILAIALIAGKALLIGKLALVLSAIIGLKKLLSQQQQKHVTYEVVAHPHHSSSHSSSHDYAGASGYGGDSGGGYGSGGGGHSSGSGGWGRSLDAQSLAYSAQKP
ncbi:keratin, type II cytoskeletal 1 [Maniola hyperantus]|uniref:keratin, type II cytoskeletal 1 n=1 Tax=Aphantopus hyperantus TaxID=2795564 RepID=UPI001567E90C|nr:keratin, type II cytoskeletal 1-like [Maniola hyperantus]